MSLRTWEKEFYPKPADTVPASKALQHSLTKWKGLTEENLRRHRVKASLRYGEIHEGDDPDHPDAYLRISGDTCALCRCYFNWDALTDDAGCITCPLYKSLGYSCCADDRSHAAPFGIWLKTGDPQPMINALAAALAKTKKAKPSKSTKSKSKLKQRKES